MIELLWSNLGDKIQIISSPYPAKNNNTQRIYVEVDLENKNYKKFLIDHISNREDV